MATRPPAPIPPRWASTRSASHRTGTGAAPPSTSDSTTPPTGRSSTASNAFNGALQGKLLVARYSAGDDIIALTPGSSNPDIQSSQTGIPGLTGFVDPLDLTEDRSNGNLYVTEFGANRITLLRPIQQAAAPKMEITQSRLIFNDVAGGAASAAKTVTVRNTGNGPLSVSGLSVSGADQGQFRVTSPSSLPASVPAGGSLSVQVVFDPTATGPKRASLTVAGNDTTNPSASVALRGLGTAGLGGASEPSLQWILDTYDIPVNVGDTDPTNSALSSTSSRIGDEVDLQRMVKAGSGDVTIEPLAVFGPQSSGGQVTNLGWYPASGGSRTQLFSVANPDYQSLDPPVSGTTSFDPGTTTFGFSSIWPFFSNREVFSEDARNTFAGALPHHFRAYPLKAADGSTVADSYVVAFEEDTSGTDYQDLVFIVRNVRPVGSGNGNISVQGLDGVPFNDRLVFNRIGSLTSPPPDAVHDRSTLRISNTGSGPLRITGLNVTGPFTLVNPPALPATIAAGGQLDVTVRFIASSGSVSTGQLAIASDDPATPSRNVQLAGVWQTVPEGGNEPTLKTLVNDRLRLHVATHLQRPDPQPRRQDRDRRRGDPLAVLESRRHDEAGDRPPARRLPHAGQHGDRLLAPARQLHDDADLHPCRSRRTVDPAAAEREPQPAGGGNASRRTASSASRSTPSGASTRATTRPRIRTQAARARAAITSGSGRRSIATATGSRTPS